MMIISSVPGGGMATHFSILAWEIPWTKEPGRLQSCQVTGRQSQTQLIDSTMTIPSVKTINTLI